MARNIKALALQAIRVDGTTQMRVSIPTDTVEEYAEIWQIGGKMSHPFPPVVVFYDGREYWLGDGHLRVASATRAGRASIQADIRSGGHRDAILYACGANEKHGERRTKEDKRKAVQTLLEDVEWGQRSDSWIAESCGVSRDLVASVRRENQSPTCGTASQSRVRRGKDGRNIQTQNIGKAVESDSSAAADARENLVASASAVPGFASLSGYVQAAITDGRVPFTHGSLAWLIYQADRGEQRRIVDSIINGECPSLMSAHASAIGKPLPAPAAPEVAESPADTEPECEPPEVVPPAAEPQPRASGPVDEWGVPVQPHAASAFAVQCRFDAMLRTARQLRRDYAELCEEPGGAYLLRPGISINSRESFKSRALEDFIHSLEDARPTYTVCPNAYHAQAYPESIPHGGDVHDASCNLCHGLGWVRALGKNEIDPKVVAKIKEAFGV